MHRCRLRLTGGRRGWLWLEAETPLALCLIVPGIHQGAGLPPFLFGSPVQTQMRIGAAQRVVGAPIECTLRLRRQADTLWP
jgi:hypothetical protein